MRKATLAEERRLGERSHTGTIETGKACIWRVGDLKAEGGRRYTVYVEEHTILITLRASYRLFFLENDRRRAGTYSAPGADVRIVGPDVVFDGVGAAQDGIHVGPNGPPDFVVIDGGERRLIR